MEKLSKIITPEKFRQLATFLDHVDDMNDFTGGDEVQQDLRRFADALEEKEKFIPSVKSDKDGFVHCPYCHGLHRHGGNGNGIASGHRMPDCGNEIGYIVVPFES